MIILTISVLIASLIALVDQTKGISSWLKLLFLSITLVISILNCVFECILFLSKEFSKSKKLLFELGKLFGGEYWIEKQRLLKFSGSSLYCNPFKDAPVWCGHNMHIKKCAKSAYDISNVLSRSLWGKYTYCDFDDNLFKEDHLLRSVYTTASEMSSGKKHDLINKLNLLINASMTKSKNYDQKYLFNYLGIKKNLDLKFELLNEDKNFFLKFSLLYSIQQEWSKHPDFKVETQICEGFISVHHVIGDIYVKFSPKKSENHVIRSSNSKMGNAIHLIDLFDEILRSNRYCCFVLDNDIVRKKTLFGKVFSSGHCMAMEKLLNIVLDGQTFELKNNLDGLVLFEGFSSDLSVNFYKDIILERFGRPFLNLYAEFLQKKGPIVFDEYNKDVELLLYECIATKPRLNTKLDGAKNYQWKRVLVDLSYTFEKMGLSSFPNSDKSISPTLYIQHLCRKHQIKELDESLHFNVFSLYQKIVPKNACKSDLIKILKGELAKIIKQNDELSKNSRFDITGSLIQCNQRLIKKRRLGESEKSLKSRKDFALTVKTSFFNWDRPSNKDKMEKAAIDANLNAIQNDYSFTSESKRDVNRPKDDLEKNLKYFENFYKNMWGDGGDGKWDPITPPPPPPRDTIKINKNYNDKRVVLSDSIKNCNTNRVKYYKVVKNDKDSKINNATKLGDLNLDGPVSLEYLDYAKRNIYNVLRGSNKYIKMNSKNLPKPLKDVLQSDLNNDQSKYIKLSYKKHKKYKLEKKFKKANEDEAISIEKRDKINKIHLFDYDCYESYMERSSNRRQKRSGLKPNKLKLLGFVELNAIDFFKKMLTVKWEWSYKNVCQMNSLFFDYLNTINSKFKNHLNKYIKDFNKMNEKNVENAACSSENDMKVEKGKEKVEDIPDLAKKRKIDATKHKLFSWEIDPDEHSRVFKRSNLDNDFCFDIGRSSDIKRLFRHLRKPVDVVPKPVVMTRKEKARDKEERAMAEYINKMSRKLTKLNRGF